MANWNGQRNFLTPFISVPCVGVARTSVSLITSRLFLKLSSAMRRKAVKDGMGPMPTQKKNNPSRCGTTTIPTRARGGSERDWTRPFKKAKTPIKNINKEPAEILYYVGCTGAFNLPARGVPTATASIFQKLGLDFRHPGRK